MNSKLHTYLPVIVLVGLLVLASVFYFMTKPAALTGNKISVLFIGNSFTYVNDLPKMVSDLARSKGDIVEYDSVAPGGFSLANHSKNQATLDKIKAKQWDFVVLQDQSQLPSFSDREFNSEVVPYAEYLVNYIHGALPAAKVVFYETWGYKSGDQDNCSAEPQVCSYEDMQTALSRHYEVLGQKFSAIVAPVGDAWRETRSSHPEIELYQADGKHPSAMGTYLAACVFYSKFFNKSVSGASSLGLNGPQTKAIRTIVQKTVGI